MGSGLTETCFVCLLIAHQFFTCFSNVNISNSSATLVLTAADQNEENGLIIKRIDENLTLSCSLVDNNNTVMSTDNIEFNWTLPFQEMNRSRTITVDGNILRLTIESLQPSDAGCYSCIAPEISGLIAHAYVAVKPASGFNIPYCSPSMFTCGDDDLEKSGAKCVPNTYLCDGRADCPTARDESPDTCGTTDPCIDKLKCGDGRCIPKNWCCYGRKNCIPHPCCEEHMHDGFPLEKTGGGLRSNPNDHIMLQATLYKACACLLAIIITFGILISAICRARLKRISSSRGHIEIPSPDSLNRHTLDCTGISPSMQDCQYSLVCHNDNFEDRNRSNRYPPSYSEYIAETNAQSSSDNMPNSSPSIQIPTGISESESNNQPTLSENEQNNSDAVNNNSPVRRPNDFGIGIIANAIFNSRYRPVPQQNIEISSLDYVTDSDSSTRSPAVNAANNLNLGTMEFNSHFYGERVGGPLDMNILQGLPDSRRLRHANALDRILDRFGLNAPYNVDIDRQYNRSAWEFQSFLTPDGDNQTPQRNERFLSSFWTRLKDRFRRNHRIDRPDGRLTSPNSFISNSANNNSNIGRCRRRPDTPDVPELTFNDRSSRRLAGLFNNDTNGPFTEISYFNRGCYVTRDVRLVSSHNFPPPYSQFAIDPPPPYVSRENLISGSNENPIVDPNGNTITDNSSSLLDSTIAVSNDNVISVNVELSDNVTNTISDTNASNSTVAFNTCDDNGNLEQTTENMEPQNFDNVINNNCKAFLNCIKCSDIVKCSEHDNVNRRASFLDLVESSISVDNSVDSTKPSTSASAKLNETDIRVYDAKISPTLYSNNYSDNMLLNNCGSVPNGKREPDVNLNSEVDCQNFILERGLSVPNEISTNVQSSALGESTRMTEECGLIFPPINLEFIDSDCNLDQNIIEM